MDRRAWRRSLPGHHLWCGVGTRTGNSNFADRRVPDPGCYPLGRRVFKDKDPAPSNRRLHLARAPLGVLAFDCLQLCSVVRPLPQSGVVVAAQVKRRVVRRLLDQDRYVSLEAVVSYSPFVVRRW
jgi:hypothetical protein